MGSHLFIGLVEIALKKTSFIAAFIVAMGLFVMTPAWAGPINGFTGTVTFDFGGGQTADVSWAVYAKNKTDIVDSPGNFTYLYTINGISGIANPLKSWTTGLLASTTIAGSGNFTGTAATVSNTAFSLDAGYPSGGSTLTSGGSSSFYFLSPNNPSNTDSSTSIQIWGGASATQLGLIMRPDPGAAAPPPGVPEPETWALLIMLSAFTMWWMRRRQDEDVIEEDFTA